MAQKPDDSLATSPKDPATGQVKPLGGPSERPGTEAEEKAQHHRAPPEPAAPGEPPAGRRNRAFPGEDA